MCDDEKRETMLADDVMRDVDVLVAEGDTATAFECLWSALVQQTQKEAVVSCSKSSAPCHPVSQSTSMTLFLSLALQRMSGMEKNDAVHRLLREWLASSDRDSERNEEERLLECVAQSERVPFDPRECVTATTTAAERLLDAALSASDDVANASGCADDESAAEALVGGLPAYPRQPHQATVNSPTVLLIVAPGIVRVLSLCLLSLLLAAIRRNHHRPAASGLDTPGREVSAAGQDALQRSLASTLAWVPHMLQLCRSFLVASYQSGSTELVSHELHGGGEQSMQIQEPRATAADSNRHAATTPNSVQRASLAVAGAHSLLSEVLELHCVVYHMLDRLAELQNKGSSIARSPTANTVEREWITSLASLHVALITSDVYHGEQRTFSDRVLTPSCAAQPLPLYHLTERVEREHNIRSSSTSPASRGATFLSQRSADLRHVFSGDAPDLVVTEDERSKGIAASVVVDYFSEDTLSSCRQKLAWLRLRFLRRVGCDTMTLRGELTTTSCRSALVPFRGLHSLLSCLCLHGQRLAETVHTRHGSAGGITSPDLAKTSRRRSVSALVRQLRERVCAAPAADDVVGSGVTTYADESKHFATQMQKCVAFDEAVEPLVFISDSDDEDISTRVAEAHDAPPDTEAADTTSEALHYVALLDDILDPSQESNRQSCDPAMFFAGAWLLAFCSWCEGSSVFETNGTQDGREGVAAVGLCFTSEAFALSSAEVVMTMLRSGALSTVAFGLRLWYTMLSKLPKYSFDCPGEIRLKAVSTDPTGAAQQQDTSSGADVTASSVETSDLFFDADQNNSFRTSRFASQYYLVQHLAIVSVQCAAKSVRVAALAVLDRTLDWYTEPIRFKILSVLLTTTPQAAVATVCVNRMKREVAQAYAMIESHSDLRRIRAQGSFLGAPLLQHLVRLAIKYTTTITGAASTSAAAVPGSRFPFGRTALREGVAGVLCHVLNLIRTMIIDDVALVKRVFVAEEPSTTAVDQDRGTASPSSVVTCGLVFSRLAVEYKRDSQKRLSIASVKPLVEPRHFLNSLFSNFVTSSLEPLSLFCNQRLGSEQPGLSAAAHGDGGVCAHAGNPTVRGFDVVVSDLDCFSIAHLVGGLRSTISAILDP